METLLLRKDQLGAFIAALMRDHRVVAPVRREAADSQPETRFERLQTPAEAALDYRNTLKAPKGVVFPQSECMIRFARHLDQFNQVEAVPLDDIPTVVLGIRPCDARSFLFLDRIFGQGQYLDPYYRARRENTLLFALACDRPRHSCFCHAFGSGPYDREGSDVLMREAGDAYLLDAVSGRGEVALSRLFQGEGYALVAADEAHVQQAAQIESQAMAQLTDVEPVAGMEAMLPALFEDPIWAEISEKCLACGTCTYACPNCHCFTIEDRLYANNGERVRGWDSCMYSTFTLHASGHNPRPNQAARWRQRTMHKFEYLPRNVKLYGCVGCGRCVISCPVRLDIRQVLRRVREVHAAKREQVEERR